jgi:putative ABC transport system substrate-binding protein
MEPTTAFSRTQRRFITLLGGAAAAFSLSWPPPRAHAQTPSRMRRIGVLMNLSPGDQEAQARLAGLLQGLQERGWAVGRNVRIDYRWGGNDAALFRRGGAELLQSVPDILLASSTPAIAALQSLTRTVPIVFVNVVDPVGAGFVASLGRPGGNSTGFSLFEYSIAGKLLELLKEIAPGLKRVAVLRDSSNPSGIGQFAVLQATALALRMELTPIDTREADAIERDLTAFARLPDGGLVVVASATQGFHRNLIFKLAARLRLPAVYPFSYYVSDGGLLSYGPSSIDNYRRAAEYVDRILKGEKPADLPVQAPVKYELVINLKTAKALGLTVPDTLLARADEVIE